MILWRNDRSVICGGWAVAAAVIAGVGAWTLAADPGTQPAASQPVVAATTQGAKTVAGATTQGAKTVSAAAATQAVAEEEIPAQPLSAAEVKRIETAIAALSADGWKERQAAQDALVPFGQAIVPRLKQLAEKAEDEEVRTRAGAALRQILENGQIGGSTITLKFKDAKPQEVFAAIAKQARCELPTYPRTLWQNNPAAAAVSIDLDRVNFWVAFKEACQKCNVFPQQMGNDRRMTLGQGSSAYWNGPSVTSGPFLIVANRIYRSNSVDLANPANITHDFSMSLSAFAEPKIRVVQSSYNVQVDEAVDEKGNSLINNDRVYNGMSSGQQWMWNLTARLTYPDNAGKMIKRFKGSVKFLVQTKSESLDVPDVLNVKNKTVVVAGRRILVKEVKKNGEQYEVQLTIYRDGLAQEDWNALQNPGYTVRLLDKDGRALSSHGWGGGGGGNEMSYNWNFGRDNWGGEEGRAGEPHRLVWEIPLETRESVVAFEFKDLPLP